MTIVRKDNTVIHSLADLKGKRIGVQLGTTAPRKPKRLKVPRSRILTRRTLLAWNLKTAMWTPLSVTCRYWSISLKRADGFLRKDRWNPKKGWILTESRHLRGKRKTSLMELNKALKELKDSGEYQKIHDKWFGAETK